MCQCANAKYGKIARLQDFFTFLLLNDNSRNLIPKLQNCRTAELQNNSSSDSYRSSGLCQD
jgi:hypothetical protein